MKIAIIGAGKMGSWLVESLCLDYDIGVYDKDKQKLKYFFNSHRFLSYNEVGNFNPDLLINAVTLNNTVSVFQEIHPFLNPNCILADITSVKNGLWSYYKECGMRFVSTHPMFGPTFGNIKDLSKENAIIYEYSFEEHDQTIAYSLSVPFSSSLVFAACMKKLEAPGTTFRKHLEVARGVLSEDDFLLSEILFSPYTAEQVKKINAKLDSLIEIITRKDFESLKNFFDTLRKNIELI
jgi:prephenate dehydrogenase